MRGEYYRVERDCRACGVRFWGTRGANYCSGACRSRKWRACQRSDEGTGLRELCEEILRRMRSNNRSYTKLLIRLLRLSATELILRGWNPHELLRSTPDDPITGDDSSPGGIEEREHERIKWLHSPERELILLELAMEERERERLPLVWHRARRAELEKVIAAKNAKARRARNTH